MRLHKYFWTESSETLLIYFILLSEIFSCLYSTTLKMLIVATKQTWTFLSSQRVLRLIKFCTEPIHFVTSKIYSNCGIKIGIVKINSFEQKCNRLLSLSHCHTITCNCNIRYLPQLRHCCSNIIQKTFTQRPRKKMLNVVSFEEFV